MRCTRGGVGEVSFESAGEFRALGTSSGVFWFFLGHFRSVSGHFWVILVRLSSVVPVVVSEEIFKSFLASLAANPFCLHSTQTRRRLLVTGRTPDPLRRPDPARKSWNRLGRVGNR